MKIKQKNILILVIILFFFSIIFFVYSQLLIIYSETQSLWEKVIKGYTKEKNNHLSSTFFNTTNSPRDIESLNFHYFNNLIETDSNLKDFNMVRLVIYDTSSKIWHSYYRQNQDIIITDEYISPIVLRSINKNDTSIFFEKISGSNFGIVVAPLIKSRTSIQFISLVYVFDIEDTRMQSRNFQDTIIICFVILTFFMISVFILYQALHKQIKTVIGYIDMNINVSSKRKIYSFEHQKPLNKLTEKISYLITQKSEIEKKYFEYKDKFFHFMNITSEGLLTEDAQGYIYFCNKKLVELLGYDDESELVGVMVSELLFDETEMEKYINNFFISNQSSLTTNKVNFLTKLGMKKECILTKKTIIDDNGVIIGYHCVISDIIGVFSSSFSQTEIQNVRSKIYEQHSDPLILLDSGDMIIDVNEAYLNFVNNSRNNITSKPFIDTIKGYELEKRWKPKSKGFEVFESSVNKWIQVVVRNIVLDSNQYNLLQLLYIDDIMQDSKYKKMILEDFRGFYYITDKNYEIKYVSDSFTEITGNSIVWFIDYYNSLIDIALSKSINLIENIVVTNEKHKYEFKVVQLDTNNNDFILYQAFLK